MTLVGTQNSCLTDAKPVGITQGTFGKIEVDGNTLASQTKQSRLGLSAHSHVHGLGLDDQGLPHEISQGLVGQLEAREAAGVVVELINDGKLAGRAVLLAGPMGTGKTAIAMGIAAELGPKIPFCHFSAAEVFSSEVKKTEILQEHLRKAVCIRIREVKEVYEGEVMEIVAEESENPLGGYGRCVCAFALELRSAKGTQSVRLPPQMADAIQKEKIAVGDIIYVDAAGGTVKRLGRCDRFASEFDLETEEYIALPRGEVHEQRQVVQDLTLHDLDLANAKPQGGTDVVSLMSQFLKPKKTEITERLRSEVNRMVDHYIDTGVAVLHPGVLFIDEAHVLDSECFSYLNRAVEAADSPVIILATNRGVCRVRAEDALQPHGIPVDFLDRLLIIRTVPFSAEQIVQIVGLRAAASRVVMSAEPLGKLGEIGSGASLRYALQLIDPIKMMAKAAGSEAIQEVHVEAADGLFLDARASALRVQKQQRQFLS